MSKSPLRRLDMARVNEGSQFYLPPTRLCHPHVHVVGDFTGMTVQWTEEKTLDRKVHAMQQKATTSATLNIRYV